MKNKKNQVPQYYEEVSEWDNQPRKEKIRRKKRKKPYKRDLDTQE